jgi:hypothetical protein
MINIDRTTGASNGRPGDMGDELDGLFRRYFQAKMPNPWPGFDAPKARLVPGVRAERITKRSAGQWQSRLLLIAASIALFIAAQLVLPSLLSTGGGDNTASSDIKIVDPNARNTNTELIKSEEEFEKNLRHNLTIEVDGNGETILRSTAVPDKK